MGNREEQARHQCWSRTRQQEGSDGRLHQELCGPRSLLKASLEICFETMTVLVDQEQKAELTYRVVPINKAGAGLPSNTVSAVL